MNYSIKPGFKKTSLLLGVAIASFATTASASFINDYDVANWTVVDAASGSVDISSAPDSIILTSGDAQIGGDTDFTITAIAGGDVTFNWSYITNDLFAYAAYDTFGYVLNGNFFELIDPNAQDVQSGSISFAVSTGDVFGFRASTFDGFFGPSVSTVSNFNVAAVPLPPSIALFGIGLSTLLLGRHRKLGAQQ